MRESDRGCVLVCAAWIDDLLRVAVEEQIGFLCDVREPAPEKTPMAASSLRAVLDGALGKASSRINFCRATEMIDDRLAAAITALFRMRNDHFAHIAGPSRLSDARVSQQLKNFTDSSIVNRKKRGTEPWHRKRYSKARTAFMDAVSDSATDLLKAIVGMAETRADFVMKRADEYREVVVALRKHVRRKKKSAKAK